MKKFTLILTLLLSVFLLSGCSSQQTGTLQMKLTDAPADFVIEKAEVTLSSISVHMANSGENESSWMTVVEEPQTFDLIELINVSTVLGEQDLAVGKYTQVRLAIDKAVVTINGTDYDLDVPSDKLKLTKGFDIVAGETTTLTLDFDAKESIKQSGKDGYKLNPTIKIIQE